MCLLIRFHYQLIYTYIFCVYFYLYSLCIKKNVTRFTSKPNCKNILIVIYFYVYLLMFRFFISYMYTYVQNNQYNYWHSNKLFFETWIPNSWKIIFIINLIIS